MTTTLQDVLKEYQSDMERMEHRIHESLGTDVPLIQQVSKYILGAGGKRFRPLLHLLSARLCGYREHNAEYILGSVVEYIHTASLLHDDVIDEAKVRRGRTSANSIWGNQASILVGDYLYSKALFHGVRLLCHYLDFQERLSQPLESPHLVTSIASHALHEVLSVVPLLRVRDMDHSLMAGEAGGLDEA